MYTLIAKLTLLGILAHAIWGCGVHHCCFESSHSVSTSVATGGICAKGCYHRSVSAVTGFLAENDGANSCIETSTSHGSDCTHDQCLWSVGDPSISRLSAPAPEWQVAYCAHTLQVLPKWNGIDFAQVGRGPARSTASLRRHLALGVMQI